MITLAPLPVSAPPVQRIVPAPRAGGEPIGVPPSGPPSPPTAPPSAPIGGISTSLVVDLTEASRLASRAVEMLDTLPKDDVGLESTKDLRIRIFKTNLAVQSRLERQFDARNSAEVLSRLHTADASLEDANWQLAKKPSPDGRFDGVDVPGAIRDTREGVRILNELLHAAGGVPTFPGAPPVGPPTGVPTGPPPTSGPSLPPPSGPVDPDPSPAPATPPTAPPAPPTGTDDGYPGEDEFPKDDTSGHGTTMAVNVNAPE